MNIDDFRIVIKKYDRVKQVVFSNVVVCETLEIRGYVTRYAELKKYPHTAQWIVSPPSVIPKKKSGKYFWIINILNPELWHQLQQKIINAVVEETNIN
jgi:hypothetical protein